MKNKRNMILFMLILLITVTGCGKGVKEDDGKTKFTCVKRGIQEKNESSGTSWEEEITHTAKVDDNGKLTYYSSLFHYVYNSKESCEYWCDIKVEWNKEINDNNYSGGHRETKCNCDKNELNEEYIYDDIPNLASILRSDIKELKKDNTFDLETWISRYEKYSYNCG